MTQPAPETKGPGLNRKLVVVVVILILCGLAVLCVAGLGGGAFVMQQATAQARGSQTSVAAEALATAAAQTATVEAQRAEDAATAAAQSAKSTATADARALALAQAATATALADNAASTATAQARADASTATAEALARSTPTVAVAAPVAEAWRLIVLDTFDANLHSWPTGNFSDQYGAGSRQVADGVYRWQASAGQGGRLWWATYNDLSAADCYAAVDVSVVAGDTHTRYGVVLRHNRKDYDLFDVGQNGKYGFYRWEAGAWTTLIGLTDSTLIDTSGVNRLAVLAQGSQFTLYINGVQVASAAEDHLRQGYTGFALNLSQQAATATVEFDNFELRVP
jgi:hypothetical protein